MFYGRQIQLKLLLNLLELPSSISTRTDKVVIEKGIYLAQKAVIGLGYYFRWNENSGPYCPDLIADIYDFDLLGDDFDHWTFSENPEINHKVQQLKDWFANLRKLEEKQCRYWFELLACVMFAMKTELSMPNAKKIQTSIREGNKEYSLEEVEAAMKQLQDQGLIHQKILEHV